MRARLAKPVSTAQEMRAFIEAAVEYDPNSGCWLWTRALAGDGYPGLTIPGFPRGGHRASWMVFNDAEIIPAGAVIRHSCHTPQCVNPAHLQPGTQKENRGDRRTNIVRRAAPAGTYTRMNFCRRGHPFDAANTFIDVRGDRGCRTCRNDRLKEFRQRRKVTK